jgi:hypothetical protein
MENMAATVPCQISADLEPNQISEEKIDQIPCKTPKLMPQATPIDQRPVSGANIAGKRLEKTTPDTP